MFTRVDQDALKDLEDPDLSDERRLALMFIAAVRHLYRSVAPAAFLGRPAPGDRDAALACVNCDTDLRSPSLYCSDRCRDVAKHIRYIRKIIHDERITVPDLQEAIGIRLLYIGSGGTGGPLPVGAPAPDAQAARFQAERDRILGEMAFRVAAPTPLRACDDWRNWEQRQREFKLARRGVIEARIGGVAAD